MKNHTTMDGVSTGASFKFGHVDPEDPNRPAFIKVSNRFATDTRDGKTHPNVLCSHTDAQASDVPVTHCGRGLLGPI